MTINPVIILMIEAEDSIGIVETIAKNLIGVANNRSNFERLPDTFWGYYARGHNDKGRVRSFCCVFGEWK